MSALDELPGGDETKVVCTHTVEITQQLTYRVEVHNTGEDDAPIKAQSILFGSSNKEAFLIDESIDSEIIDGPEE